MKGHQGSEEADDRKKKKKNLALLDSYLYN